ncbi:hypothetical protein CLOTH_09240 [Alkalithermobacter paradoxus]|uniref:BNR/Asp-box repeat protein n=2 Tax=Alkalithermobacter paradoxus TaxID=29349 RepID=A0A1V4I9B0_9FIRM|nr:hypothetical protein CLOTH_09240 [[Clostridium] thermoalcaliphilum]
MPFINRIETIIKKSNEDIIVFHLNNQNLCTKEFKYSNKAISEEKILKNIVNNDYCIKIDSNDKIYGIANCENGEVVYLYTDDYGNILSKKLFEYDKKKYIINNPYIKKYEDTIHILYYIQSIDNKGIWSIFNHYYDGEKWTENNIDNITAYPVLNPFVVNEKDNNINIFYFNKINGSEEIFLSKFNPISKLWNAPIQITNTSNKKIYLSVLSDEMNLYNITWSEFINENLVVRYMNGQLKEDGFYSNNVLSLSEQSNCSFPTLIKIDKILWNIWTQMDRIYSSYSLDYGKTWSIPNEDDRGTENIIRYKFISNSENDVREYKLDTAFGTYYPSISFVGFQSVVKDSC